MPCSSRKRKAFCVESQEDMNDDGTPVKAPPTSRRPPTSQQSPQPSVEDMQLQMEVQENCSCVVGYGGEHRWTVRDRTVIARIQQHPNENDSMKVAVEE